MGMHERTELLLGKENLQKLQDSKVIVFGVGGYVCEVLARTGVGNLTIVDFDTVQKSNINRQIIALHSTIGKPKVEVMKERLLDINPNINITAHFTRFDESTKDDFLLTDFDYIVDAIDLFQQKLLLITHAKGQNCNIISSMGAGNRFLIPHFKIDDIYNTTNDSLAKKMRKLLKRAGVQNLTVCYSDEQPLKQRPTASVAYYPSVCGIVIGAYVIGELIK